jgi:hypothetical protein
LVLAALYLFGYRGSFGLNVLEFIGIGDVLSHALYPFVGTLVLLGVGYVSGALRVKLFPPIVDEDARVVRFTRKHWNRLVALVLVAVLIVIFAPEAVKWFVLTIPLLFVVRTFDQLGYFITLIPSPQARSAVLYTIPFSALFAFAQGRLNGYQILDGQAPLVVDVRASGLHLLSDEEHPVSYVGHVSDFFVLYESSRSSVVILRTGKVASLALIKNPKIEDGVEKALARLLRRRESPTASIASPQPTTR